MSSVEVRGATKSYESGNFVLKGLNLTIEAGSIYSLIGPSGCGKTTLLSCILGMRKLDGGIIRVFGEIVSHKKPSKFSRIIGYMPQETALVPELTVKETLLYFGNIYQMDSDLIMERLTAICDLLELSQHNSRIEHLSGGEKRRISLAAALIHDPRILILDEPTVGVDSILREKIWTHLMNSTKLSGITVVITTHYIAEAEKSDCCGLMSNGKLLAEDGPRDILSKLVVSNLEEAFFKLCYSKNVDSIGESSTNQDDNPGKFVEIKKHDKQTEIYTRKKFSSQTIKALFTKEILRIKRQPGEIIFTFLLPIIQAVCFAFTLGRNPAGLQLGIVNYEVKDYNFCSEFLNSTNYSFNSDSCYFENLSCYFLDEIKDETATKVYYNSFEEAYRDAKSTKTVGFITIASNFTNTIKDRKIDWQALPTNVNETDANQIEIYLDHTNLQITNFLNHRLYKAFERLNKKVLRQCNLDEHLEDPPVRVIEINGSFEDDYLIQILPANLVQLILLSGILFSVSCISQFRNEGIWNRTLLTGVTTSEILLVQILVLTISDVIQIFVFKISIDLLHDINIMGNPLLIGIFCFVVYLTGSCIGLLISIHTNNISILSSAGLLIFFTCGCLGGGIRPIESQHLFLQYISKILPTTLPTISIRNIIAKGFGLSHITIYSGFLMLGAYITIMLIISFFTLRMKKYTK